MKRKFLAVLLLVIACLMGCIAIALFRINAALNGMSVKERNEIDFYREFLYAKEDSAHIPIEQLVPVAWDSMKVFRAYATAEDKIEFAGYPYEKDLQDINYEDMVSLLFLRDGKVVYYVDLLLPRLFQYENLENGLVRLSKKGWYSVELDASVVPTFSGWAYYPQIEEANREEEPYFEIRETGRDTISLVLDCKQEQ